MKPVCCSQIPASGFANSICRWWNALAAATALIACASSAAPREVATRYRTAVNIPDIPGYVTLKCDFHIHTVFSDGVVWPTVRAEEAWRQGLDAIAITDHLEYRPHQADLSRDHNRGFEIASEAGRDLNLLVVHGSEITHSMPPGHLNALFLTNSTPLAAPKWEDAVDAAHRQGAFIFWNHPGWERQITNGLVLWYPEHTRLLAEGKLQGIEVASSRDYYPEAHRWALEKKLTMLSNSDIHEPINHDYQIHNGDHRPLTLVFARERTAAALKEALLARRTVVYSGNRLIGEEQYLRPIFERSITLDRTAVTLKNNKSILAQISNSSDIDYELELAVNPTGFTAPKTLTLVARSTVLLELKADPGTKQAAEAQSLSYRVTNLLVAPEQALSIALPLKVSCLTAGQR